MTARLLLCLVTLLVAVSFAENRLPTTASQQPTETWKALFGGQKLKGLAAMKVTLRNTLEVSQLVYRGAVEQSLEEAGVTVVAIEATPATIQRAESRNVKRTLLIVVKWAAFGATAYMASSSGWGSDALRAIVPAAGVIAGQTADKLKEEIPPSAIITLAEQFKPTLLLQPQETKNLLVLIEKQKKLKPLKLTVASADAR